MAKKQAAYEAAAPATDKKKALETAMAQIKKNFGAGSVMRLGDAASMNVEVIPTGSLTLDLALGVGGLPKGRIVEIYGPESSGKTTLALHVVAEAQKMGGEVAFVDAEHALDPEYAAALGVDIENMLVSQPDYGEQALEITDALVRSGAICRGGCGLRCSPDAPGRDRGRNGRVRGWPPGPPDVSGTAEAGRLHRKDQLPGDFHQPDS